MEGTTYLERPAPAVYLDSWPMEGKVRTKKLEWKPVITPADSHTLDSRPVEGMTYLEHYYYYYLFTAIANGETRNCQPNEGQS